MIGCSHNKKQKKKTMRNKETLYGKESLYLSVLSAVFYRMRFQKN